MKAIWNNALVAQSDNVVFFDNQFYFPKSSLKSQLFHISPDINQCPIKGKGQYFDLIVDGQMNPNAACIYELPIRLDAKCLKDMVSFSKTVKLED